MYRFSPIHIGFNEETIVLSSLIYIDEDPGR